MIVNIPAHKDLSNLASGWLKLAWSIAIGEAQDAQEASVLFDHAIATHGEERVTKAIAEYWDGRRLELNNALSLLQQSLDLFLKSRIAEVSPFLLLAGDSRSWPSPTEKTREIDFTDFRTIDASQLCRAAQLIAPRPLPRAFEEFYERLRKTRNKIVHLNGGNIKSEVRTILTDILQAHKFLFPGQAWVEFLRSSESARRGGGDYHAILFGHADNVTNDVICREVDAALFELEPSDALIFFGYQADQPLYRCPTCLERSFTDSEQEFVQLQRDNELKCLSCLSVFSVDEYKEAILKYFAYLGAAERKKISDDLDKCLD